MESDEKIKKTRIQQLHAAEPTAGVQLTSREQYVRKIAEERSSVAVSLLVLLLLCVCGRTLWKEVGKQLRTAIHQNDQIFVFAPPINDLRANYEIQLIFGDGTRCWWPAWLVSRMDRVHTGGVMLASRQMAGSCYTRDPPSAAVVEVR